MKPEKQFFVIPDQEVLSKHSNLTRGMQKRRQIHLQGRKVSQLLQGKKPSCEVNIYMHGLNQV